MMRSKKETISSLVHIGAAFTACVVLCSCGAPGQDYFNFQKWESSQLASEQALRKHQLRYARTMAAEAISAARTFGNKNFRLALSLRQLGDVEKTAEKSTNAEKSYKQAVAILKQLEEEEEEEEEESSSKQSIGGAKLGADAGAEKSNGTTDVLQRHAIMEDLADCQSHLGELYFIENRYEDSIKCLESATKRYQSIFADSNSTPKDIILGQKLVQSLRNLAEAAVKSSNLELAKQSYQQALITASDSKAPEYLLRDIRDEELRVLQQAGDQSGAASLASDRLFGQYSADGQLAFSERDFTTAEIQFRKAFQEAKKSLLSERRILRSLSNLVAVFCREGKIDELEKCRKMADDYVEQHQIQYHRDYDEVLDTIASFDFTSGRYADAVQTLDKQLIRRIEHFGQDSKEACATMALKGRSEYKLGNLLAAQTSAISTYRLLKKKHMSDRRCAIAMGITADLLADLKQLGPAEELTRRLVEIKIMTKDAADPDVIAMETKLFALFHSFHEKEKAARTINEIVNTLDKARSPQKVAAFPYLVLILSYCTAIGWYEQAEPIARLGQSILHNELSNSRLDDNSRINWTKDIALMQAQLGRSL